MIMDGNATYMNIPFPMNVEVAGTEYYIKGIGKALFNSYNKLEGMGQNETTYSQEKLVRFHIAE